MLRRLVTCSLSLVVLIAPASVQAQTASVWQPTDYTASVADLWVTIGGAVFVKAIPAGQRSELQFGTLARSDDVGSTWTEIPLPPDLALEAIDPTNGTTMFGASIKGLHRSLDGGATWSRIFPASPNDASAMGPITRVHISASDHNLMYIQAYSVYRSRDGGLTWTELIPPSTQGAPCYPDVGALEPDANDPQRLFYAGDCVGSHGSYAGIVAMSHDQGTTWTPLARFSPRGSDAAAEIFGTFVRAFTTGVLAAPDRIFSVGYSRNGFTMALSRSDDGGQTWTSLQTWRGYGSGSALVVDPADPDHLYLSFGYESGAEPPAGGSAEVMGVSESGDGGASWTAVGQAGSPGVTRMALAPDGTVLYGGTRQGVYVLPLASPDT
ncbi:MAG: hypothetical protein NVSMB2_08970 [Chloroflexota bacterium]